MLLLTPCIEDKAMPYVIYPIDLLFFYFYFYLKQRQASEVLNVLRDHPDAWTKVDSILEFSKCQETKYYALQILEKTIKTRWKALQKEQCEV